MKILLASSEVVPFSKTGGLADVCGALPVALEQLGHEVIVFVPSYRGSGNCGAVIDPTGIDLQIPIDDRIVTGTLGRTCLPGSNITVYLVEQSNYFDRGGLYGDDGGEFEDNCERYTFFCRAVLESIRLLNWKPDLIHANDWQTGLIPTLLKVEYSDIVMYEGIASLMTIHNLAYQGSFWYQNLQLTGIDRKYFNWQQMESYGNLNLLKSGLVFADGISTVSPTYAQEIQGPEQGCGLDGLLTERRDVLSGILNGIDVGEWNPEIDPHLSTNYSVETVFQGKAECKAHLRRQFRLYENERTPLIGIVGRLATQKGWSLILPVMRKWLASLDVQWVVLGTGDTEYHRALESLHRSYPDKFGLNLGFSNQQAHQIEAGADMFVMPSQYEPCGLNQMYSMAYGTVPVVRQTGGLADTVVDTTPVTIENRTANGFSFVDFSSQALESALHRAVDIYHNRGDVWQQLIQTGMRRDWSWTASARQYVDLYQKIIVQHKDGQGRE
jgi:starch synthase